MKYMCGMEKILLINCRQPIVNAFKSMGCEVQAINTSIVEFDLYSELNDCGYEPDLILQQESLGCRVFLLNLHKVDCMKIFWSVDTHLNMHWHALYGSLFDVILTTQKKYVPLLKMASSSDVHWLPWMGGRAGIDFESARGIIPYTKRKNDLSFVGRLSAERPSRTWFVDFIAENFSLNFADNLNYTGMMSQYRQTRIVPNESIFGEINFRLFEACSCGCAVVTPDTGSDVHELFEVGRDIEIYKDVLELDHILKRLIGDSDYAAKLAMRGYERVLKDHLPINRVKSILEIAESSSQKSISDFECSSLLVRTYASLAEAGQPVKDPASLIAALSDHCNERESYASLLRILAFYGDVEAFMKLIKPYLSKQSTETDCYFSMSLSLAAAKLGLWDIARLFWYQHSSSRGQTDIVPPEEPVDLLVYWGDELRKCGLSYRAGVKFSEKDDIPSCAADCYFAALYLQPKRLNLYKKLNSIFAGVIGTEPTCLGFLSNLSLHNQDDWHISAELGIVNLKAFRLKEGVQELRNAHLLAESCGQLKFFKKFIAKENPLYYTFAYH